MLGPIKMLVVALVLGAVLLLGGGGGDDERGICGVITLGDIFLLHLCGKKGLSVNKVC